MANQAENIIDSTFQTHKLAYGVMPYKGEYQPDYTYKQWALDITVHAKHYLSQHKYHQGESQNQLVPNWIAFVLILVLVAVAYSKSFHAKRFKMILKGFFNWKVSQQIIRYEKVYAHPVNILLSTVFLVTTSLLYAFYYFHHYNQLVEPLYTFGLLGALILIYGLLKLFVYSFSAWLFNINEMMEDYSFQSSLFNKLFGLINLILLVFYFYSTVSQQLILGISISILLIFMLMQLVRGLLIGIQNAIPLHLIILYLCTLEILPWLIIGKWIGNLL